MALITDFASLKADVAQYGWRTGDTEFESAIDGMIQKAGARLNRKLRLRVMTGDAELTGTSGSRTIALPDDYVEPFGLSLTTFGAPRPLRPSIAGKMALTDAQGTPGAWSIDGGGITLNCLCDQAHTFLFNYRKSFVLSEAAPTNWLLDNHPDIYLAAVCVWGGVFMRDQEEAVKHKAILEEGLEELAWLESRGIALAPLGVDAALVGGSRFNVITG